MASYSTKLDSMGVVVLVAAAVASIMMVGAAVDAEAHAGTSCQSPDEYVFPYLSGCKYPATLYTEYHYVSSLLGGGLEPEWDESNSTYYVRVSDQLLSAGANYVAQDVYGNHLHTKPHDNDVGAVDALHTNSTVYIYNIESRRVLQWRKEGTDEYFLIEKKVSALTDGAPFRFLKAEGINIPCPLIYPKPQCNAYYLVSDPTANAGVPSTGMLAFTEGGATYIKSAAVGSVGEFPLLVTIPVLAKPGNSMPVRARLTATN